MHAHTRICNHLFMFVTAQSVPFWQGWRGLLLNAPLSRDFVEECGIWGAAAGPLKADWDGLAMASTSNTTQCTNKTWMAEGGCISCISCISFTSALHLCQHELGKWNRDDSWARD